MASKIGLISDVHATPAPLAEALAIFTREGVAQILCAGDIAGYGSELAQTIAELTQHDCQCISGNHDRWFIENPESEAAQAERAFLRALPRVRALVCEGIRLYMVHAAPPAADRGGIRLLDEQGRLLPEQQTLWREALAGFEHDVLIVGHTHQVFAERLGPVLAINPGSTVFNHSCAILHLPSLAVEWFGLSGRPPLKAWNWSAGLFEGDA